jgi:hypothetical protein
MSSFEMPPSWKNPFEVLRRKWRLFQRDRRRVLDSTYLLTFSDDLLLELDRRSYLGNNSLPQGAHSNALSKQ